MSTTMSSKSVWVWRPSEARQRRSCSGRSAVKTKTLAAGVASAVIGRREAADGYGVTCDPCNCRPGEACRLCYVACHCPPSAVRLRKERRLSSVWDEALARSFPDLARTVAQARAHATFDVFHRYFRPRAGDRILESGSGSGIDSLVVAANTGATVTLLDRAETAATISRRAAEMLGVPWTFLRGDCRRLPLPRNAFDIVWNNGVNEHFAGEERQLVFDEMARVCRPGGYLAVAVPNRHGVFYRMAKGWLERSGRWPFGFEQPYSRGELTRRLREAGLEVLGVTGFGLVTSAGQVARLLADGVRGRRPELLPEPSDGESAPATGAAGRGSVLVRLLRRMNRSHTLNQHVGAVICAAARKPLVGR